ncbi:DNA mismatch repair endonuclease MutL [Blautia sp. SG-772]|nr:DNA mismatch repair endonuclease MutL [Blautia sp. SG-772]
MKRQISVLDQSTIDKIAAGEVVERPSSVVKELVENAIDAGASAITVEIKEGGTTFIRITDNGTGIEKEQVPLAFLRHATSKIRKVEDLSLISSLGFRGEALSSIAAVSRVELITKPHEQLIGVRYQIEGGMEKGMEEIGAPDGTTFLIRDLFYNTPARAKFLKTPTTEAGYISSFIEQLALSHPHISFKYMQNGQTKLHTSGNNNLKEAIYQIYGRDITRELIEIHTKDRDETIRIDGFIGKPVISRGNRNFENYYVNGRYVKSKIVTKAVEDAYHTFMMQHKYPFTCLHIQIKGSDVDVNVHPTKMEVRFSDQEVVYRQIYQAILQGLQHKELIPQVTIGKDRLAVRPANRDKAPEPFEVQRRQIEQPREYQMQQKVRPEELKNRAKAANPIADRTVAVAASGEETHKGSVVREQGTGCYGEKRETGYRNENPVKQNPNLQAGQVVSDRRDNIADPGVQKAEQMDLFDGKLLSPEAKKHHKIIGQVFDTYWLVQMEDKLYIIDQHAAHEKVLYERIVKEMKERNVSSQIVSPPIIISLNLEEQEKMKKYQNIFETLGFEIESFGGREYSIRAVPQNLFGMTEQGFFIEVLDHLEEDPSSKTLDVLSDRMATMACKAAVKGNQKLSLRETEALIDELLQLENPYNCPHGRPTIISMTKYELEKKFKRIV